MCLPGSRRDGPTASVGLVATDAVPTPQESVAGPLRGCRQSSADCERQGWRLMPCRRNRRDLALARQVRELWAENDELEAENIDLRDALLDAMARNAALSAELEATHG